LPFTRRLSTIQASVSADRSWPFPENDAANRSL
jgi:hypothetical protein